MPSIVTTDLANAHPAQIAQLGPGRFEIRVVPIAGSDLQALTAQIRANADRYFGPRTAEGKLKNAVFDPDDFVPTPTS